MTWVNLVDGLPADADEMMENFYHVAQGDLLPRAGSVAFTPTSSVYDLGSTAYRWDQMYVNEIASTVTFSSQATFNGVSTFTGDVTFSSLISGSRNMLIACNIQADGVAGGSCGSVYAYTATALSTLTVNYITGATLSSNTLTLPAGSYICNFSFNNDAAKCILWNSTASTTAVLGDVLQQTSKALFQSFTLETTSSLVVKAAVAGPIVGATSTAMGHPTSFGESEMYGFVAVYKV